MTTPRRVMLPRWHRKKRNHDESPLEPSPRHDGLHGSTLPFPAQCNHGESLPSSSSSSPLLQRPSLVLPLTLSYPNASQLASARRGIDDDTRPNARMRLHNDLLTNGYYMMRFYIGTPPQEFALIMDSRSTLTYVPCATSDQCGNHQMGLDSYASLFRYQFETLYDD